MLIYHVSIRHPVHTTYGEEADIADTPSNCALFIHSRSLICLTFDTCPRVLARVLWCHQVESIQRSMMWLRQMAQLSTTMSHAQRATAFHWARQLVLQKSLNAVADCTFLTSNRFLPSEPASADPPAFVLFADALAFAGAAGAASVMSTSAILCGGVEFRLSAL